jgi:hypothetical protein
MTKTQWHTSRVGRYNEDGLVETHGRLMEVNVGACDKPIWLLSKKKMHTSSETWEGNRRKNPVVDWPGGRLCGFL